MFHRIFLASILLAALMVTAGCAIVYNDTYEKNNEVVTEVGLFGFPGKIKEYTRGLIPVWRTTKLHTEESPFIDEP